MNAFEELSAVAWAASAEMWAGAAAGNVRRGDLEAAHDYAETASVNAAVSVRHANFIRRATKPTTVSTKTP